MECKNVSYLFIPFSIKAENHFYPLMTALKSSQVWAPISESDTKYMLKYVADKLNCRDEAKRLCFHYHLRQENRGTLGFGTSELPFVYQSKDASFRFRLLDAHLYCFSTTVCIIALALHIEAETPFDISNAQYYLKKVSRGCVAPEGESVQTKSILELAKELVKALPGSDAFDFFFYAEPGQERANFLTCLEVLPGSESSYNKELFYLRHCYNERYLYRDDQAPEPDEFYLPSPDIQWGISSEAAVCLTCPDDDHKEFTQGKFFRNFNTQYLFMYVLLLHQKYVLYLFLTRVNSGTQNDLQTMEEYQRQLYEFEMNFTFSHVTEVPQYQELYSRIARSFSLSQLFEDVQSPLVSLSEVRQAAIENQQKRRDKNVNKALLLLSLLSFFSALTDSFTFAQVFFGLFLTPFWVGILQAISLSLVCIAGFFALWFLLRSTRD